jgi:hypothetical protein
MRTQSQMMHGCPKDEARLARLLESALTSAQRQSLPCVADAVVCAMESLVSATGNHQRLDTQYGRMLADALALRTDKPLRETAGTRGRADHVQ